MNVEKSYKLRNLGKEINEMCNLSVGIREEGILEGINQGINQGISKGIGIGEEKATVKNIASIMQNTGFSIENVMSMMSISENKYDYYRERINEYLHNLKDNLKS